MITNWEPMHSTMLPGDLTPHASIPHLASLAQLNPNALLNVSPGFLTRSLSMPPRPSISIYAPPRKVIRFSQEQIQKLETYYRSHVADRHWPKEGSMESRCVAMETGLSEKQVKIYCRNKKTREAAKRRLNAKLNQMKKNRAMMLQESLTCKDPSSLEEEEMAKFDASDSEEDDPDFPDSRRFKWSEELHKCFLEAVKLLRPNNQATPQKILMYLQSCQKRGTLSVDTSKMTRHHVASHLQKFRLKEKAMFSPRSGSIDFGYGPQDFTQSVSLPRRPVTTSLRYSDIMKNSNNHNGGNNNSSPASVLERMRYEFMSGASQQQQSFANNYGGGYGNGNGNYNNNAQQGNNNNNNNNNNYLPNAITYPSAAAALRVGPSASRDLLPVFDSVDSMSSRSDLQLPHPTSYSASNPTYSTSPGLPFSSSSHNISAMSSYERRSPPSMQLQLQQDNHHNGYSNGQNPNGNGLWNGFHTNSNSTNKFLSMLIQNTVSAPGLFNSEVSSQMDTPVSQQSNYSGMYMSNYCGSSSTPMSSTPMSQSSTCYVPTPTSQLSMQSSSSHEDLMLAAGCHRDLPMLDLQSSDSVPSSGPSFTPSSLSSSTPVAEVPKQQLYNGDAENMAFVDYSNSVNSNNNNAYGQLSQPEAEHMIEENEAPLSSDLMSLLQSPPAATRPLTHTMDMQTHHAQEQEQQQHHQQQHQQQQQQQQQQQFSKPFMSDGLSQSIENLKIDTSFMNEAVESCQTPSPVPASPATRTLSSPSGILV